MTQKFISLISLLLLVFFSQCNKDDLITTDHYNLDLSAQGQRVSFDQEILPFHRFDGMKGSPNDYTFTIVATVAPPSVLGTTVYACHVVSDGSQLYVAYNMPGDVYRGALDIISYTLDPTNTTLTPVQGLGFNTSDINAIELIPSTGDSYEVFAVGATVGYTSYSLFAPAFMICFDPTLTTYDVKGMQGYAGNSISYYAGKDAFITTSGADGLLSVWHRSPIYAFAWMGNSTPIHFGSVKADGDTLHMLLSTSDGSDAQYERGMYWDYPSQMGIGATTPVPLVGHDADILLKTQIETANGYQFLALNNGGIVILDALNNIVESINPSNPASVPTEFLKSNGLCVSKNRLYSANGGGGLSIAELDPGMQATLMGNVVTGHSVNHVIMLEDQDTCGYLALSSGKVGTKIVYYTYSPGSPPTVTTTSTSNVAETSALSGGEVTDDGTLTVTARGVCWSTSSGPTVADNVTINGTGTGVYTSHLGGLANNTTYYVRAYATNNKGTTYGSEESFTTLSGTGNTFVDSRDGRTYKYVTFGKYTWMAENLRFTPSSGIARCYGDTAAYCDQFGYLYDYYTAEGTTHGNGRDICPIGWHLPDSAALMDLYFDTPGSNEAAAMRSSTGWDINDGTNTTGFNALPGGLGYYSVDSTPPITDIGRGNWMATWFGYTPHPDTAGLLLLQGGVSSIMGAPMLKHFQAYVRCIKDSPPIVVTGQTIASNTTAMSGGYVMADNGFPVTARGVCWSTTANPTILDSKTSDGSGIGVFNSTLSGLTPGTTYHLRAYATSSVGTAYGADSTFTTTNIITGTFTDARDGHVYNYVTLGNQTWMAENLAYLPNVSDSLTGSSTIAHQYVYRYHGTDVNAAKLTANFQEYGVLYNAPSASANCPAGWHLPTDAEWKTLEMYLGMDATTADSSGSMIPRLEGMVGSKLKSNTAHWIPGITHNNSSQFTALPGGAFIYAGAGSQFGGESEGAVFWTATSGWHRLLHAVNPGVYRIDSAQPEFAFSVRCVKD